MLIHSGIRDGQVLQRTSRGASASLTGSCDGSGAVAATIERRGKALRGWNRRAVGRAARGKFTAKLTGIPSGGPYRIRLAIGAESATVRDICVGDVWILAGQSNMEGIGNLDGAPKPRAEVRAHYMDGHWAVARDPLHHLDESPDIVHNAGQVSAEMAARTRRGRTKGTGVGVYFGAEMVRRTGVPQGLICVAHGGTSMEQWDPAKAHLGGGSLYGSMLRSVRETAQPVAGMLWYQGESDANIQAEPLFCERMRGLVRAVRRDFGAGLPVVMVQIARHLLVGNDDSAHRAWNAIQEHQRLLARSIPKLACVAAIDLPLDDSIHISAGGYARLAKRLARAAARLVHGDRSEIPPPEPASVRVMEPREWPICPRAYEVRFTNVVDGLRAHGEPAGFSLVDAQGRDIGVIYKTELAGDRVILETVLESEPPTLWLQYGATRWPRGATLVDGRDLAVPVFGPLPIGGQVPSTPFATVWRYSGLRAGEALAALSAPTAEAAASWSIARSPVGGFMDMHLAWEGKAGHALFSGGITAPEDMAVTLRFGYDGPFRLWFDGKLIADDPDGTNPARPDAHAVDLRLTRGRHQVAVAMALNGGVAWGFFLRCVRRDLGKAALARGEFALPAFDAEPV